MSKYFIGQLAKEGGVKADTIRFYEKLGLLPKPVRTENGYRRYDEDALKRLKFIGRAKSVGFSLNEIEELLAMKVTQRTCEEVFRQAQVKVQNIEQKIEDLQRMKGALEQLGSLCKRNENPERECPFLDAL